MKNKKPTKKKRQTKEISIESELKGEFGSVYSDDFLDEEALILAMDDDYE